MGTVLLKHFWWVQRSVLKPQSQEFYRYKHILNRQRRKWRGAFTWITWTLWKKKKWTQNTINTLRSFLTPMTGLDNTQTTTMIALLLLALVAHSFALPLPSEDRDNWLLAEVSWLQAAFFFVTINERLELFTPVFFPAIINVIQLLFSFNKQKYLRRFYDLPAGLQGRQRSSGAFETKIKEMQTFFRLKVTTSCWYCKWARDRCFCICYLSLSYS